MRLSRLLIGGGLRRVLATVVGVLALGTVAVAAVRHVERVAGACTSPVLTALGGANPQDGASILSQAVDLILVVVGVAVIPAITAAVVGIVVKARLAIAAGGLTEPVSGHVIVVGLGNVGARVCGSSTTSASTWWPWTATSAPAACRSGATWACRSSSATSPTRTRSSPRPWPPPAAWSSSPPRT